MECDEDVDKFDELDKVGYNDLKRYVFVGILNSDCDDEGKKRGFSRKNGGRISHEVVLGVLWV